MRRRLTAAIAGVALCYAAACGGPAPSPTAPTATTGPPAGETPPFQLRVDNANASRLNVGFYEPMPVRYSACYSAFPIARAVTVTSELTVFGPNGEVYPTTPYATEERRLVPGYTYAGCGRTSALDSNLVNPLATRYRLTYHYVESDGRTGSVWGEAGVDSIVRTPAVKPPVVIHEFTTHGTNGALDQFVELKNVGSEPVTMTGWYINLSNAGGHIRGSISVPSVTLPAGCHLLLASEINSSVRRDYDGRFAQIEPDGGLGLFNRISEAIDQVALSHGAYYREGTPLQPLPPVNRPQSYERHADTDNNAADFVRRDRATPTSSSVCAR